MKFVYILINNKKDFTIQQSLLSIYSLKKNNKDARIALLMDDNTYNDSLLIFKEFVDEIKIIDVPKTLSSTQKSRFIKTSIPQYIEDDFIYIDNDTIITGDLDDLNNLKFDIGAIWNQHRNDWNRKNIHHMLMEYYTITGLKVYKDFDVSKSLYNGGVLVCKQTEKTRKFFLKWHNLWLDDSLNLNFDKDQISLWRTNHLFNNMITPLEGIYNCQLLYPNQAKNFIINAKILHYFSSSSLVRHLQIKNIEFLNEIKKDGILESIDDYLSNIKNEYLNGIVFLMDKDKDIYFNPINVLARKISYDLPFINKILNYLLFIFCHRK